MSGYLRLERLVKLQSVKGTTKLCHPLLNEIDVLYAELSEQEEHKKLIPMVFDISLQKTVSIFEEQTYVKRDFKFVREHIKPLELPKFDPKNIIVCFSGGKDSFAVARHYQKLHYNVYLYHLRGLNATYCGEYSEHLTAEKASEYLGLPLVIEDISYSGYHEWIEHPLKNMIMATRALSYGVRNGITTKIAVGSFKSAYLDDNAFDVCGGDCVELWRAYDRIIRRVIPKYHTYMPNSNYQTAYELIEKEPQALEVLISCMTPNRFRRAFRERTIKKYGIDLLPNRCGCCWKDCVEYIWFADRSLLPLNKPYYIHCLEVIANTHAKETGLRYYSVRALWGDYFFYPIEESILSEVISDAVIQSHGKVICTDNSTER